MTDLNALRRGLADTDKLYQSGSDRTSTHFCVQCRPVVICGTFVRNSDRTRQPSKLMHQLALFLMEAKRIPVRRRKARQPVGQRVKV